MLTGMQIRMAAAALRWPLEEIAKRAKVGAATIQRMAAIDGVPTARATSVDAVQRAFEAAGVSFHDADNGGPGVWLVKPPKPPTRRKTAKVKKAKTTKRPRKRPRARRGMTD